ncbi:MAG: archease [Cuniculiplasma sp.]
MEHQADTKIRIFDLNFDGVIESVVDSFREILVGKFKSDDTITRRIRIKENHNFQLLAIDAYNELIFLMDDQVIIPMTTRKIEHVDGWLEIEIGFYSMKDQTIIGTIPKAATCNSGDNSSDFFDVTLDL